jgi:hypothetical protein
MSAQLLMSRIARGHDVANIQEHCIDDCQNTEAYQKIKESWVPLYVEANASSRWSKANQRRQVVNTERQAVKTTRALVDMGQECFVAAFERVSAVSHC